MKVIAIIPARGGSKRLPSKNIFPVLGKPMITYSIEACLQSSFVSKIIVSTDCEKIKSVVSKYPDVCIHNRSHLLSDDKTYKQDVIVNVLIETYEDIEENEKPDIVLSVQANSPQISAKLIDNIINCKIKNNKKEIFTVDRNLMQNGAIRAMDYKYCFLKTLSMYCGVYQCNLHDVHTVEDVKIVEKLIGEKNGSKN